MTARRVVRGMGAVALVGVALVLATWAFVSLPAGRRTLADALEVRISRSLGGSVSIGTLEALGIDVLRARDVVFRSPEGEEVLRLAYVELDPDVTRLLREGAIASRSGRIQGATLRMIESEGEGLGIERAFDTPGDDAEVQGVVLDLRNIAIQDLDSEWRIEGAPTFHLDDMSGHARFWTDERGQVAMRFDRLEADGRTEGMPLDVRAEIERASGTIRTGREQLGRFSLRVSFLGSPIDLELRLVDGEGGVRVRATSDADPASLGGLAMMGVDVVTTLAGSPRALRREDEARREDQADPGDGDGEGDDDEGASKR